MKNTQTLRYFPLEDSMVPSLAVVKLFASVSAIFGFCIFWGQTSGRISEMGTNLYQITGHGSPIISTAQYKFMLKFRKIAPFQNGRCPVGSGAITSLKTAQNFEVFDTV